MDEEEAEVEGRSATKLGRIPLKERTQSPGRFLLSPNDDSFERRQARLARAAASQKRRSVAFVDSEEQVSQFSVVLSKPQTLELLNNCIKLAAENKINQQNTWDLKLIDYLSDVVKPENEEDTQTNFQKASCTLEASAKIYSCRVDSVHSETYKVLGGLNRSSASSKEKESNEDDNADECPEEHDVRRKETHRKTLDHSANLETFESLNVKHFDVSLNVDPLFHQTSAQFDEGGAKGLLLNNLSVYRGCEILFDSLDIPEKCMKVGLPEEPPTVNLSFMADTLQQTLDDLKDETEITPSLKEIVKLLDDPFRAAAEAEKNAYCFDTENEFDDADTDMGEVIDNDYPNPVDTDYNQGGVFDANSCCASPESAVTSPTRENDEEVLESVEDSGGDQLLSELTVDWLRAGMGIASSKNNSWAGPDHWKFIKAAKGEVAPKDVPSKEAKKKKEPFSIVYTCIPDMDEALLAKPRDLRANLLPQSRQPVKTTLPEDFHFQADDLFRLFLRPSIMCIRGRVRNAGRSRSLSRQNSATPGGVAWNDSGGYDIDGGDEDCWGGGDAVHSDCENDVLVVQPRKIQKIEVNYETTSKQVDVRALKQSLWEQMDAECESHKDGDDDDDDDDGIRFKSLLKRLPATSSEEVSVHLCFICLLHLANEHNLVITGCPTMDDLQILRP